MNEYVSCPEPDRNHSVFIHCPSQIEHLEPLCALTLAVIASGYGVKGDFGLFDDHNVRLENIAKYISESKYSIHNCSFCETPPTKATEYARYNLPIELGMALAERYRIQRIHNRDSNKISHDISVFVSDTHEYCEILSGLILSHQIYKYKSIDDVLRNTIYCLPINDPSSKKPKVEQVKNIWESLKQNHPEHFNNDGYVDKDDLCKDILNLCKKTSWWKEPEWITNRQVYNVFLAHNSNDKPQIQKIQAKLEDDYKLKTWIDIEGIRGGELITEKIESAIKRSKTIAIFFGQHGEGNWQSGEIAVAMARCFEKEVTVIPVLLPGFQEENLPLFVRIFRWVKFKNIEDTQAIEQLYEGITGKQLNQHNLKY